MYKSRYTSCSLSYLYVLEMYQVTSEFLRDWDQTKVPKQSAIPSIPQLDCQPEAVGDSNRFARCDVQVLPRSSEGGHGPRCFQHV